MKVRELIEWLSSEDQNAEVHIAYNYGDRSQTTVAPKVTRVEETPLRDSDYFRMPVVIEDNEEEGERDGDVQAVVLFARGC